MTWFIVNDGLSHMLQKSFQTRAGPAVQQLHKLCSCFVTASHGTVSRLGVSIIYTWGESYWISQVFMHKCKKKSSVLTGSIQAELSLSIFCSVYSWPDLRWQRLPVSFWDGCCYISWGSFVVKGPPDTCLNLYWTAWFSDIPTPVWTRQLSHVS